ncbi:membrane protease YdiL (CAAX protease family) [Evansella vedderi]|uniref:Membrane protease YdiL (CAAX protease family) n=1 Tax=Evansella vedderi TaxID=38282 RepID=A0ABT9ZSG1_9BACI|nr:type II CAAX endopeptidase family protein [Evansella vedderi]MDQ0254159.1 membrane protease YdiL (CAAX protease family) [Evansella vedderi]
MTKRYWLILISFIFMQLATSLITVPILLALGVGDSMEELLGLSMVITFSIGFLVILLLAIKGNPKDEFSRNRYGTGDTILWCIIGFFMAYAAQITAALIQQYLFGIEPGSENTQLIVDLATAVPLMIIVVAILVPIMEEIVFRMVIFGSLYKRFGFWIAALLSGFIFAVVHLDFENLLVYLLAGVVFAYLYVKTKRIIVPIIAHVGINSFVMIVQVVFGERLQRFLEEVENLQAIFIGGLF